MSLTHKERVQYTLQHHSIDRLPAQINYTAATGEEMTAHFGFSLPICLLDWIIITIPIYRLRPQKNTDDNGQHFIVPNVGFCLFERAWSRGFTNLME